MLVFTTLTALDHPSCAEFQAPQDESTRLIGYFALMQLLRMHSLLGDYRLAMAPWIQGRGGLDLGLGGEWGWMLYTVIHLSVYLCYISYTVYIYIYIGYRGIAWFKVFCGTFSTYIMAIYSAFPIKAGDFP